MNRKKAIILTSAVLLLICAAMGSLQIPATNNSPSVIWKNAKIENYANRKPLCDHFSKVLIGKTEQEVVNLLGEPEMRGDAICGIKSGEHEKLTYSLCNKHDRSRITDIFIVNLKNGIVVKAEISTWAAMLIAPGLAIFSG